MSPEELDELRKSAEMVHCIGIQNAAVCRHPYNGVNNASFALVNLPDLLAHIDSQAAQIEATKKKLVEERAQVLAGKGNLIWEPLPDDDRPDGLYPALVIRGKAYWRTVAHQQIEVEMPEVEWE